MSDQRGIFPRTKKHDTKKSKKNPFSTFGKIWD